MTDTVTSQIEQALATLPPTSDEIAKSLFAQGWLGDRFPLSCPLAKWLSANVNRQIGVTRAVAWDVDTNDAVVLPQHVARFVYDHDTVQFPFLYPNGKGPLDETAGWPEKPGD